MMTERLKTGSRGKEKNIEASFSILEENFSHYVRSSHTFLIDISFFFISEKFNKSRSIIIDEVYFNNILLSDGRMKLLPSPVYITMA